MSDKDANRLCIISLILMFVMPVVTFLIAGIFMNGDISGTTAAAYAFAGLIDIASYIAAWVLAVIARIKYKSKFGTILLIIYGSILVLTSIGGIVLLIGFLGGIPG